MRWAEPRTFVLAAIVVGFAAVAPAAEVTPDDEATLDRTGGDARAGDADLGVRSDDPRG